MANDEPSPQPTSRAHARWWAFAYLAHSALVVWLVTAYVGPGKWLGALQLKLFGAYLPVVSVLVLFLPLVGLARLLGQGKMSGGDILSLAAGRRFRPYLRTFALFIIGAILLNIIGRQAFAPVLGPLTVEEALARPEYSFYAEVGGWLDTQGLGVGREGRRTMYLPLRSLENSTEPVRLIVSGSEHQVQKVLGSERTQHLTVSGYVSHYLPDDVESWLRDPVQSGEELAKIVLILRPQVNRERARLLFFGLAAVVAVGGGLLLRHDRKRARSEAR